MLSSLLSPSPQLDSVFCDLDLLFCFGSLPGYSGFVSDAVLRGGSWLRTPDWVLGSQTQGGHVQGKCLTLCKPVLHTCGGLRARRVSTCAAAVTAAFGRGETGDFVEELALGGCGRAQKRDCPHPTLAGLRHRRGGESSGG